MTLRPIALVLLAACASAPPPASPEPEPAAPIDAAALPPPIDAPPPPVGYRARIDVPAAGGAAASWIEIEVLGDGEAQHAACAAALIHESSQVTRVRADARTVRACELAPLPTLPISGVLLVDSVTHVPDSTAVRVAEHIAMPSQTECEVARQRREADNERADSEAQVRAGDFLAGERDRQKELADRACATEAEVTTRCRRATTKRTRERCATEQTSATQECQRARELLAAVEQRVATPVPRPVRAVTCQLP